MKGWGVMVVAGAALALASTLPKLADGRPAPTTPAAADTIEMRVQAVVTEPSAVDVEVDELALVGPDGDPADRWSLPARAVEIEGQRVRIRGYMSGTPDPNGKAFFLLNGETQVDPASPRNTLGLRVQYMIPVRMRNGLPAEYTEKPLLVEGRLVILAKDDPDGRPSYRLDDARVEPIEPRHGYHNSIINFFAC